MFNSDSQVYQLLLNGLQVCSEKKKCKMHNLNIVLSYKMMHSQDIKINRLIFKVIIIKSY